MNTDRFGELEHRRLLEIAREYEGKGYRVELEPLSFSPAFGEVRPDLVAISEEDSVVVEVVSKPSMKNRERLERLAKAVETMPGWRFELVVTNPKGQTAESISLTEIRTQLEQARHLERKAILIPALLGCWAAIEALLRHLAAFNGFEVERPTPLRLVKTLYSHGVLSRSDYEWLEEAVELRNAAVHGFRFADNVSIHGTLERLFEVANRLLQRLERTSQRPGVKYMLKELVQWFFENYEDPANGVPYEGGYIYALGGPYHPWDELLAQFPDADEELIEEAAEVITREGTEWVRRGQY